MDLFLYLIGPRNGRVLSFVVKFGRELVLRLHQLDGVVGTAVQDARADPSPSKHDLLGLELFALKGVLVGYLLLLDLEGPLSNSLYSRGLQRIHFVLDHRLIFLLTFESDHVVGFELEFVQELLLGRAQSTLQVLVQGEGDLVLDVLADDVVAVVLGGLDRLQVILTVLRPFGLGGVGLALVLRRAVGILIGTFLVFLRPRSQLDFEALLEVELQSVGVQGHLGSPPRIELVGIFVI